MFCSWRVNKKIMIPGSITDSYNSDAFFKLAAVVRSGQLFSSPRTSQLWQLLAYVRPPPSKYPRIHYCWSRTRVLRGRAVGIARLRQRRGQVHFVRTRSVMLACIVCTRHVTPAWHQHRVMSSWRHHKKLLHAGSCPTVCTFRHGEELRSPSLHRGWWRKKPSVSPLLSKHRATQD
jgi:hypothetical protein